MTNTGISFHRETVEILTGVATSDRYGNVATDWENSTTAVVSGCRLVPIRGEEVLDRLTRRWVLYAPLDAPVTASSRVRWDGNVYDVAGDVRRWRSVSGLIAHIEVDLERVEG
jgi:head-tail adaptor